MPVEEVSAEVGYADVSFFRRVFKRMVGLTPKQYRRMFQPIVAEQATVGLERISR